MEMASKVEKKIPSGSKYEEGVSIRAQKRKRALEHYRKKHKVKKTGNAGEELSNETSYYIENGLRKVYPYYFNFKTYVKGRWLGKTVLDVYRAEFKQDGIDPEDEIKTGNIMVNEKKVPLDFVLRDNMMIEHKCHRHEMPVLDVPIEIIEDTDELLVINKPASIPVHPCGRYRYNSVTMLLRHELGYDNLRILYRLDRLTSGLLIMPKTTSVSRKLEKQLGMKELYKEYVCRVDGKFPDGEIVCNEPLGCMSYKLSLYRVDPQGKPSSTSFRRTSYNGKTSVVKCVPHTGRTHQIRVHLQFLGYPICNDPLYNNTAFGPNKGKGGIIEAPQNEVEAEIMKSSNIGRWKLGDNPKYYEKYGNTCSRVDCDNLTANDKILDSETDCDANQGDRETQTGDVGALETISAEKKQVILDGNTAESPDETDGGKTEVKGVDDNILKDNDTDNTESFSLEQNQVHSSEACSIDEETEHGKENGNEESDHPCKRVKINSDCSHVLNHSQSSVAEKQHESCHNQQTEQVEGSNTLCSNEDSLEKTECLEKTESVEKLDTSVDECGDTVTVEKSILAEKVTDPQVIESKMMVDEFCQDCKYIFEDPKPEELIIYLHAVKYKGANWEYSTPLPYWALEDFDEEKATVIK